MADLISLNGWRTDIGKKEDLNSLLKRAIEISKKIAGKIREGVFIPEVSLNDLLASRFNQVLLKEGIIDSEIFRCALYAARLFEEFEREVPESYYGTEYFVRGWQEGKPMFFRKGGDVCFLVCTFFEEFAKRRTSVKDFQRMGSYLYSLYCAKTRQSIGWCMSNNFKSIVHVAQEGIKTL